MFSLCAAAGTRAIAGGAAMAAGRASGVRGISSFLAMVNLKNFTSDTLFLGFFDPCQKSLAQGVFFIIMNTAQCDVRRPWLANHGAG